MRTRTVHNIKLYGKKYMSSWSERRLGNWKMRIENHLEKIKKDKDVYPYVITDFESHIKDINFILEKKKNNEPIIVVEDYDDYD